MAEDWNVNMLRVIGQRTTKISDLERENEVVTVEGTVATLPAIRETMILENGKVKMASFKLADETGEIEVSLWKDAANFAERLSLNDRVRISNAYTN